MSKNPGVYELPADAKELFDLYYHLYKLTKGSFTPLIGQTLSQAGYDGAYSLKPGVVNSPPAWIEALSYNFPSLEIKKPVILDFGAAGKGYLIDLVSKILSQANLLSFTVDAGGDIFYYNKSGQELEVGLENPLNISQAIGIAKICNSSICGSAGSRRTWGEFHHIIDPLTRQSPKKILATWVVAKKTIIADALATCLFFTPAQSLIREYAFEYALMYADRSVEYSQNFPANFFSA
jgi:thiamine biosynthesis lipoprotein